MEKVIQYTVNKHIDRLQLSFACYRFNFFLDKLSNKYGQPKPIREGKKFIYQHRAGAILVELISWGRDSFKSAINVHDPDDDTQQFFSELVDHYSLSQVEVAWDFYPQDPNDLYLLKCALAHKVVLRHGRVNSFRKYKSRDKGSHWHSWTAYQGKKGNARKSPKGVKIYTKLENPFVRLEVNLNKQIINRKKLVLPVNVNEMRLSDYIFARNNLDSERLVEAIIKRARATDDPLAWAHIRSHVSCMVCEGTISQQISALREKLPEFKNRVGEFFQESEDILGGMIAISYQDLP